MVRTHKVNGKELPFSAKEEAARDAEDLVFQNKPPEVPDPLREVNLRRVIDTLIAKNIVTLEDLLT